MIKRYTYSIFLSLLLLIPLLSQAQLLVNDGDEITITGPGALLFVDGGILNQDNGTIDNADTIMLTGDWENNAGNTAFINSTPGYVVMSGDTQKIKGTDSTLFYNLTIGGTNYKSLENISTTIEGTLDLTDKSLRADDNTTIYVTNPDPNAILFSTGYVSTRTQSTLSRATNSTQSYIYPMGADDNFQAPFRYRPIEITPSSANNHTYAVRFSNTDATTEGKDRSLKDTSICLVNPDWYHEIYQNNGSDAADITFYFDNVADGDYDMIGRWMSGTPLWRDLQTPITKVSNASPSLSSLTKTAWTDFSEENFALVTNSPIVNLTSSLNAACDGDDVTFTATGGFTDYTFYINDTLVQSGAFDTLQTDSLENGDAIRVLVEDLSGCRGYSNWVANIVINPLPVADAGKDTTICVYDSVMIGGSPSAFGGNTPYNYSWSPATGLNDNSSANPMASPPKDTTYVLTVTDNKGCQDVDSVNVNIYLLPLVDAGPNDTICQGDSAYLNATGGVSYVWDNPEGLNDQFIQDPIAFPFKTTTYTVIVTDSNGCQNVDSMDLYINPLPVASAGPPNISICLNDSVQIGGSPSANGGTPPYEYSWTPSYLISDTADSNPYVQPTTDTTYEITVTDINGCQAFASTSISIFSLPPANAGVNDTLCKGDSIVLNGDGGVNYLWSPKETLDDPAKEDPTATPTKPTEYVVVVTDSNGCVNSDSVFIHVYDLPVVDAGPNDTICVGDSARFNATGGVSYSWDNPEGLSNPVVSDPFAFPIKTTEFTVIVTDSNGCKNSDSLDLYVNSLPVVDAGPNDTICYSHNTQLNASGGIDYSWTPGAGLDDSLIFNPVAGPQSTTSYTVTATDTNGCSAQDSLQIVVKALPTVDAGANDTICAGESTQLSASSGTTYLWTPFGEHIDDPTAQDPTVSPKQTTTYTVRITNSEGCSDSDSVVVMVNPLPVPDITGPDKICFGDTATLTASGGDNYEWGNNSTTTDIDVSPADTTDFFVKVTDVTTGCFDHDTFQLNIVPLPDITIDNQNGAICLNDSATLTASGGDSYLWETGETSASITVVPDDITTYTVTAYKDICSNSDSIEVIVFPNPNVKTWGDTLICPGKPVKIYATGGNTYSWTPNDKEKIKDPNQAEPTVYPEETTTFYVVVSDGICDTRDSVTVEVSPIEASFESDPEEGFQPLDVKFTNTSTGVDKYQWNFGDGNSSTIVNPGHKFVKFGKMTVTLYVTDTLGCIDSAKKVINVIRPSDLEIPNVFTPDGDGVNDIFKVKGTEITSFYGRIFNRWGTRIFVWGLIEDGWDGRTLSGEQVPEGTYYYIITATGKTDDVQYEETGTVTLIRGK